MRAPLAALAGLAFALAAVPASAQTAGTIPGARWYRDATVTAYRNALASGRPLVLMIGEDGERRYSTEMIRTVLPSSLFDRIAAGAVLAYANPSTDPEAARVVKALRIERYPTIVLLAPNREKYEMVAKVEGVFPADTIVSFLASHMRERGWRVAEQSDPLRPTYQDRRRGKCM